MSQLKAPKIEIKKYEVKLDPPVEIWNIEVFNEEGTWTKSYGSEEQLLAFIRGVKAGCSMFGVYAPEPEIPETAETIPSPPPPLPPLEDDIPF